MKAGESATDDEVVLAFLQAEIESPRFRGSILRALATSGVDQGVLIDNADLANHEHNAIRARLLDFRGLVERKALFEGFPTDMKWRHVELRPTEFGNLRYLKYPKYLSLSQGTRSVVVGASNVDVIEVEENGDSFNAHIRGAAAEMEKGRRHPPLIGVETGAGDVVLAEGNTRATAHIYAGIDENIKLIVGTSPSASGWVFY
jgi:hypothetical protein